VFINVNQVTNSFKYLTTRLETMNNYASDLVAFRDTVTSITTALADLQKEQAALNVSPTKTMTATFNSPLKAQFSGPLDESASQVLRHLDIQTRDSSSPAILSALETAHSERHERLVSHYTTSEASMMKVLASTLDESDVLALLSAAYANTAFDTVHLSNPKLEGRLETLEEGINEIGEGLARLDAGQTMAERKKTEEFVSNWGH